MLNPISPSTRRLPRKLPLKPRRPLDASPDQHDIPRLILCDCDICQSKELTKDRMWVLLREFDPTIQEFERDPVTTTCDVEMNART